MLGEGRKKGAPVWREDTRGAASGEASDVNKNRCLDSDILVFRTFFFSKLRMQLFRILSKELKES